MSNGSSKKPWYKKGWGIIIAISIWPIFLIWFIWAKMKWHPALKTAAIIPLAIFGTIYFVAFAQASKQTPPASSKKVTIKSQDTTLAPKPTTTSTTQPASIPSLITEPQVGITPFISLIQGASKSVDLVLYQLEDQQVESALTGDASHNITVRVLLNQGEYGKQSTDNEAAYNYLKAHGVQVKWTPSYFALTHQKTLVIDDKTAEIMTLNFTPQYYSTSRDFALSDTDQSDVSAIEAAFNADWNDKKITAPTGTDLVWSPGSQDALVSLIGNAKHSVYVYNEEMSNSAVIQALEAAAKRGVTVEVDMTNSSDWKTDFTNLTNAGVQVRTYAASAPLYIHAKMILTDSNKAFLGSENFSNASLDDNRELGLTTTSGTIISSLVGTFNQDWQGATPFTVPKPTTSSPSASPATGTSASSGVVKLSTTMICHAPGDAYYDRTTNYTPYPSMAACEAAGGRPSER